MSASNRKKIRKEQAIAYGIGLASHEEIDEMNILQATFLAMQRGRIRAS